MTHRFDGASRSVGAAPCGRPSSGLTSPVRRGRPQGAAPTALVLLLMACEGVPADGGGDPPIPECTADLDGAITADELPLAPGVAVRYARNEPGEPVTFDVDGVDQGDGTVLWDFSEGPRDVGATLTLLDPAEAGVLDAFPTATYAVPLIVETPDLLGVFQLDPGDEGDAALSMLGLVTVDGVAPGARTHVHYDEPLALYRFPLEPGDAWEQTVTYRDAVAYGIPNQGVETYRVEVEQTLAIAQGDPTRTVHQLLWVRPCFGEIARAVSADPTFSQIDELRRYDP